MNGRSRTGIGRIAQIALIALALAFGLASATALAESGDDGSGSTTGTTGTTHTTPTTPEPGAVARGKVNVVGIVAARDEAARTFVLRYRKARTLTVRFERQPQVGRMVQVKGRKLADGTVEASRVKLLRGCEDDEVATTSRRGSHDDRCDDVRGRGRGGEQTGDKPGDKPDEQTGDETETETDVDGQSHGRGHGKGQAGDDHPGRGRQGK